MSLVTEIAPFSGTPSLHSWTSLLKKLVLLMQQQSQLHWIVFPCTQCNRQLC